MKINNEVILQKEVKNNLKNITPKQLNKKYINQLVIKYQMLGKESDFRELLTIMYKTCGIENKIKYSAKKGYIPYITEEDLFALFCLGLDKCVNTYDKKVGNFTNYVAKTVDVMFKEERKQSFLKVTGKIDDSKKMKMYAIPTEELDFYIDELFETDKKMMDQELIKKVKKLEFGDLLFYKYMSGDKVKSDKKVAEKFDLTEKQVRNRIKKANEEFKRKNKDFFNDYFYKDGKSDLLWFHKEIEQ